MAIWVDEHAGQGGGGGGSTPSKVSWGNIENKPETFKPEDHTHTIENIEDLSFQLEGKVSKKDGYNLSQENYTPVEKLKLESIPPEISKGFVSTVNGKQGEVILDKGMVGLDLVDNVQQASKTEFDTLNTEVKRNTANIALKVDRVEGKELSTNDFTNEYKTKIETNSTEIDAIKEQIGNELPKEVQANRESSLEQPNLKNIVISTTEPEEKYEGLIWIKPLVEGV